MKQFNYEDYLKNNPLLKEVDESQMDEIFGLGGTKATEKDSIRLDVRGGSIIFKPFVQGGLFAKVEKNDSDFDSVREGEKLRIDDKIKTGEEFSIGTINVKVNKIFLNGKEVKSVSIQK